MTVAYEDVNPTLVENTTMKKKFWVLIKNQSVRGREKYKPSRIC